MVDFVYLRSPDGRECIKLCTTCIESNPSCYLNCITIGVPTNHNKIYRGVVDKNISNKEISKFNPTDAEIEAEYQWSMRNRQTELWEYGSVL